jgi:hypothetical protein
MEDGRNMGAAMEMSVVEPVAEPIFTSAHAALKFAFNFSHGTLKKSFLATAQGGCIQGRGLAGLDGAAQAGMILAELNAVVTPERRNLIAGRFAPQTAPCSCRSACCCGFRENAVWGQAVDWLTEYVLIERLTGMISHLRLRRTIVMRYFGVKKSFVAMADACGVHRTTASEYNKAVVERFKREERLGFYEIEGRLKERQIVAT